jgi:polyisoprenoid-binding protein YceI
MITMTTKTSVLAFLICISLSSSAAALSLKAGSLWLEGDSTLHAYKSTATVLSVSGAAPEALVVTVDVKGLKSGDKGLDKNMYNALKAEANPQITFKASKYEHSGSSAAIHGLLSIAGVEKPVTVQARVEPAAEGTRVQGSKKLLMSEFGIKPPKMFLGTLKVRDRVVIHFDILCGD